MLVVRAASCTMVRVTPELRDVVGTTWLWPRSVPTPTGAKDIAVAETDKIYYCTTNHDVSITDAQQE